MTYDEWKLDTPDEADVPGYDVGADCMRYHEPDEDAPRGYRPKPCLGIMVDDGEDGTVCDTCGEAG